MSKIDNFEGLQNWQKDNPTSLELQNNQNSRNDETAFGEMTLDD